MSKLIFLDVDGVLNSHKYFHTKKYLEEWTLTLDQSLKFDPEKIKLVNKLVEQSGANVVVSSAWRLDHSVEELNFLLKQRGATFEIADKTPVKTPGKRMITVYSPRGHEIQEYLDIICMKPESFVILDDFNDMAHLLPYLVRTDNEIGITEEDVQKALDILEQG